MTLSKIIEIKNLKYVDSVVVSLLYSMAKRSVPFFFLLSALAVIALYPQSNRLVLIWFSVITTLSALRLFFVHLYARNYSKYSYIQWYKIFTTLTLLSGLAFSLLGFVLIFHVDTFMQLLVVTFVLGLSSGATSSLYADIRLHIAYISILIIPLIIALLFLSTLPVHFILSLAFFMYYITQVYYTLQSYAESQHLNKLEFKHGLMQTLFQNAPLGVFTYNRNLEIIDCNSVLCDILQNDRENIIGKNLNDLADMRAVNIFKNPILMGANTYEGYYTPNKGTRCWIEAKAFSYNDTRNNIGGNIGIVENKTKEHNAIKKLEYTADHDLLTNLLNRRGFIKTLNNILNHNNHETYYSVLYFLDLNQFKSINDSLGHAMGDKVLLEVSMRLSKSVDSSMIVARLSGDEFVLVIPFISEDIDVLSNRSKVITDTILEVFSAPFVLDEMHLYVSASIGIVYIRPNDLNTEEILRCADLSMYQAKKTKSSIAYYTGSLDIKQKKLFMLQQDLAYAQSNSELKLFFQPIVEMKCNKLFAAEMLLRWEHPIQGMLSPEKFIPLAIKAGLLSKITWWLIENVCQQISNWKKEGQWNLKYISINISPYQLLENSFPHELLALLAKYDVGKSEIMLEITESSLVDNFENTQKVISELKEYGVKCAIDDFGVGYSSLSYLKKLSFHTLKIDREFIKDIESNPKELLLVSTILDIGRQFNYNIVIEGVEDKKQKDLLLGLDEGLSYQGFYFSKPLHAEVFREKFLY